VSSINYQKMVLLDFWPLHYEHGHLRNDQSILALFFHQEFRRLGFGINEKDLKFCDYFNIDSRKIKIIILRAFREYFVVRVFDTVVNSRMAPNTSLIFSS